MDLDLARLQPLQERAHALEVERLVSVSSIVWRTSRWSGISMGPTMLSWHAAACGNTAAMRSSASMRWIGGGLLRPPRKRSTSNARLRFHRQRARNIGESRMAWRSVSSMVRLLR